MKYLVTSVLDKNEKRELKEKGLFCYDLRHSDEGGEIATIERTVVVNRCGSIITNEEIVLEDKEPNDYKDYQEFIKDNECVNSLEELLNKNDISKLEFLEEIKDMINYNIMCYSEDYSLEKAKVGYEKEFIKENNKLMLVKQMIKEEKQKVKRREKNKEAR